MLWSSSAKWAQTLQHHHKGQGGPAGRVCLMLNMVVLCKSLYMQAALSQLRANGEPVNHADVAKLSPLLH